MPDPNSIPLFRCSSCFALTKLPKLIATLPSIDRLPRGTVMITEKAEPVCLVGGLQPDKLRDLFKASRRKPETRNSLSLSSGAHRGVARKARHVGVRPVASPRTGSLSRPFAT
jgi:hypothetical protein